MKEIIELEYGPDLYYFRKMDPADPGYEEAVKKGCENGKFSAGFDYDIIRYMRFDENGQKRGEKILYEINMGCRFTDQVSEIMSCLVDEGFDMRKMGLVYAYDGIRHYRCRKQRKSGGLEKTA